MARCTPRTVVTAFSRRQDRNSGIHWWAVGSAWIMRGHAGQGRHARGHHGRGFRRLEHGDQGGSDRPAAAATPSSVPRSASTEIWLRTCRRPGVSQSADRAAHHRSPLLTTARLVGRYDVIRPGRCGNFASTTSKSGGLRSRTPRWTASPVIWRETLSKGAPVGGQAPPPERRHGCRSCCCVAKRTKQVKVWMGQWARWCCRGRSAGRARTDCRSPAADPLR